MTRNIDRLYCVGLPVSEEVISMIKNQDDEMSEPEDANGGQGPDYSASESDNRPI